MTAIESTALGIQDEGQALGGEPLVIRGIPGKILGRMADIEATLNVN